MLIINVDRTMIYLSNYSNLTKLTLMVISCKFFCTVYLPFSFLKWVTILFQIQSSPVLWSGFLLPLWPDLLWWCWEDFRLIKTKRRLRDLWPWISRLATIEDSIHCVWLVFPTEVTVQFLVFRSSDWRIKWWKNQMVEKWSKTWRFLRYIA